MQEIIPFKVCNFWFDEERRAFHKNLHLWHFDSSSAWFNVSDTSIPVLWFFPVTMLYCVSWVWKSSDYLSYMNVLPFPFIFISFLTELYCEKHLSNVAIHHFNKFDWYIHSENFLNPYFL